MEAGLLPMMTVSIYAYIRASGGHSSRCDSPSASSLEPEEPGNCNADERFSFLQGTVSVRANQM